MCFWIFRLENVGFSLGWDFHREPEYFFLHLLCDDMANANSHVTLAYGVGFFCNEPEKIPGQLEILQAAREGNVKMLDTSRIYVCHTSIL